MIRRPVTTSVVVSRIKSGNYNKNSIGSISLENYIGGKKTKKQKAKYKKRGGNYPDIPEPDLNKLNIFSNLKTSLIKLIPFK